MEPKHKKRKGLFSSPTRVITLSFAGVILAGTFFLMLPISSRSFTVTPFLDCLFTSTSATCVTGLIRYDTYLHWSLFGQCIILGLIQIGGLGLVTFTTFFNLMIGKKLGLRGRDLAQQSVSTIDEDIRRMVTTVIRTSLTVELIGALLLMTRFVPEFGAHGIFLSVFTSISAFCNAGFDLFGFRGPFSSLTAYNDDPVVLLTIGMLIIIGGIGFIVLHDLAHYRKTHHISLHTRVVLVVTAALILLGMLFTAVFEWDNPATLGGLPSVWQRLGAAWFHSVSCRTAGFNTLDLASMHDITKIFSSVLMFFGAAPGSTGGGIKCTTVAVIFMTVYCVVRGRENTTIFHRTVDKSAVYKSLAVTILGLFAVIATAGCIVITMRSTHAISGVDAIFESVSAFATVGLSIGVSGVATIAPMLLLIFSMYLGRLGPVTFFLSLAMRTPSNRREVLPEGKILIG